MISATVPSVYVISLHKIVYLSCSPHLST